MGESLPARGMPARDPDHPTSPLGSGRDRDTDDEPGDRDDDRLIGEIDALAPRVDPVPEEVVEAARRAFKTRKGKKSVAKSVAPRGSAGRKDPS